MKHLTGILGWPLQHSLSPEVHNAAFRALGLDWVYIAFPVSPEMLAQAVTGLRALGALGANVTMPHKETIIEQLDEISGDARAVGAVNTIQRIGDRMIGHNTDVDGFATFLTADAGFDARGKRAVVLGAGGAARAVVKALDDLGAERISVVARRVERGHALLYLVRSGRGAVERWEDAAARVADADLVVNATPVGVGEGDPLPNAVWGPDQVVVDLVYNPPATALVKRARAAGASGWGGLGMLIHQAASSFQIWTGQDPPLETMSAAAVRAIRQSGAAAEL